MAKEIMFAPEAIKLITVPFKLFRARLVITGSPPVLVTLFICLSKGTTNREVKYTLNSVSYVTKGIELAV